MTRLPLLLCLSAVAAAGQSSSSQQQQRAFDEYQRIVAAQRQFGDLNGFSSQPICQACGPGYVEKLSPRSRASFVSVTTLSAPKKARKEFLKAQQALLGSPQRPDKARAALRTAVELYPGYAAAWSLLGKFSSRWGLAKRRARPFCERSRPTAPSSNLTPTSPGCTWRTAIGGRSSSPRGAS